MQAAAHVLAIVGPTASGKSSLAMEIANAVDGEIIGADSRQVYRHMDIGTAKPSHSDRARVRHHLVDMIEPDEEFSLALFVQRAREAIDSVLSRDRVPIVVGGTGQYVWGLLEGWDVPNVPPDDDLRVSLNDRLEREGIVVLAMELEQMAPSVAARIDLKNPRRVVRALEIAHRHGGEHVASPSRTPPPFDFTAIGLTLERAKLYDRLNARTDVMFEDGWVGEVAMLQKMGHGPELPSMSSLGYLEIFEVLSGDRTLEDAAETIKRKTRRFARKQYAWFRLNDERIRWFESTRSGFDEAVDYAKRRWESHVIAGNSVSSDSS